MMNTNASYLITGSSGFLGFHFARFLANKKISAIGIYNLHTPQMSNTDKYISFIKCNLLNLKEVQGLPKTDVVIHFAAQVTGADKIVTNEIITKHIVRYCNAKKSKLVFISSSQVLYSIENSYIISKKKNEEYIKQNCKNFTIIRPAAPYGKEIKQFALGRKQPLHVLAHATRFPILPIIGNGNNTRQPLHVNDLSKFILQVSASVKTNHKTYNIGGPDILTYDQIINAILDIKKRHVLKIHIPVSVATILARFVSFTDPENIIASTIDEDMHDNWKNDFSLRLTSFQAGCRDLP